MNDTRQTPTRREAIKIGAAAAAAVTLPAFFNLKAQAAQGNKKLLFFTKSAGFQHSVVTRQDDQLAHAERILVELGKQHGFDVEATKDGRVFDKPLDPWDAIMFYTTGDLTQPGTDMTPPMSPEGKQALLDAIHNGKGFIASHCGSDTFHSAGDSNETQEEKDPYIQMLGGEFIVHGEQQNAVMTVVNREFPGMAPDVGNFQLLEEWYSLKNFAPDLHVLLVNETQGMRGAPYERPPYPATWARAHGKGRVFYTSMGHREDVWTNPIFQNILVGGIRWASGAVDAEIPPNIDKVTPQANTLPKKG